MDTAGKQELHTIHILCMDRSKHLFIKLAKNIILSEHTAAVWQTSHLTCNYTSNTYITSKEVTNFPTVNSTTPT